MDKLKFFFKNLTTEYLRIAETRKTCPHVIKFEKVTNYIFVVLIALTIVFGIVTNASASEPSFNDTNYSVSPTATTNLQGAYKFTSLNINSVGDFTITGIPIYTLRDLGVSGGNDYDGIRWHSSKKILALRSVTDGEWKKAWEDGYSTLDFWQFIYIPSTAVDSEDYNLFIKLYDYLFTSGLQFGRLQTCYAMGETDSYTINYPTIYQEGYDEGLASSKPFANIIGDIFDGLDNFVIFGDFSILDIIKAIMGIFLAVWLLKLIAGG